MFMCMYVYSMFVLSCVGRGLAMSCSLIQRVLPYVYERLRNRNRRPRSRKGCRATEKRENFIKHINRMIVVMKKHSFL
jgi:hypothetical protein